MRLRIRLADLVSARVPWRLLAAVLAGVAGILATLSCTTAEVRVPEGLVDPATVSIVDYGPIHTSLLLPADPGQVVELAYGEWDWFVEGRTAWYRIFPVLCWPTRGALGRRELSVEEARELLDQVPEGRHVTFAAERARIAALRRGIEEDFAAAERVISSPRMPGFRFIPAAEGYHACHTCNDVVIRWLEALGCEVGGALLPLDFEVDS
jgi:hypothetical protein